jgi:PadR family transcriptional regulator, regulatory protein PadR
VRKDRLELLQGTLDMLVMKTLANGPLHGYNIVDRLRVMSSDIIRVEEGSLYPALHRMEERGWIEAEWGTSENNRKAKYYRLTRAGRKQLQTERTQWSRLSQAITGIMEAG